MQGIGDKVDEGIENLNRRRKANPSINNKRKLGLGGSIGGGAVTRAQILSHLR